MNLRIPACILTAAIAVAALAGCASGGVTGRGTVNLTPTVSDLFVSASSQPGKPDEAPSSSGPSGTVSFEPVSYSKCDIDLTRMNGNMVYAEVSNIMSYPERYVGKVIKMKGTMFTYEAEERMYYSCLIPDATACCAQGLEFVLNDPNQTYPDHGTPITVIGRFETYEEDDYLYGQLARALFLN